MQAIRKKLAVASTRRRLKQLWSDYKKAAGLGAEEERATHLNALMDSIAINDPEELNTIFDDWSDIVAAMLEMASKDRESGAADSAV